MLFEKFLESKVIESKLLSNSIINERKRLFSPRSMDFIIPDEGAVMKTPGFFLSSNNFCPDKTVSPSFTNIVGLSPI